MHLLLALLIAAHAHAEDLCTPIAQLEPRVNYCDENSAFVAPARACRDQFKAQMKKTNDEITESFRKIMKNGGPRGQGGDFQATDSLLTSAESRLDGLISNGFEIFDELSDYEDDLVLPIYSAYPEDFKVDPHSAAGRELFRGKECYGEPMEDIDNVKVDLRAMIQELEKTEAKAKLLHAQSRGKATNLSGTAGATVNGVGSGGPAKAGASAPTPSTITGVDEAKKKDAQGPAQNPAAPSNP